MEREREPETLPAEAAADGGLPAPSPFEASGSAFVVDASQTSEFGAFLDCPARVESSLSAPSEPFPAGAPDMPGEADSSCCRPPATTEGKAFLPWIGEAEAAAHAVGALSAATIQEPAAAEDALDACSAETGPAEAEAAAAPEKTPKPSDTKSTCIPRLQGRRAWRPRGQRRSFGRLCRGKAAAGGCAGDGDASSAAAGKRKWQQMQQQKQQQREARELERQARAAKEAIRVQRRKQREAKRQRKKENELKSAKVQVIKDTSKIRKWNKQARRQLVKMSPEMIKQLYGVQL
ncbi:hypothetical protein ACSSS7_003640 [Eimeria intestinalis]